MAEPSWLTGVLAVVMIVIAVYCTGRLIASRLRRRPTAVDADGLHLVMGVAMAGMLVPRLGLLPGAVWEGVFGAAAAWFALQAARTGRRGTAAGWRCPDPVPHLVECGAMVYMFLAVPGSHPAGPGAGMPMPGMAASPGAAGRLPALALVLALFMLGYVVWATDRLTSRARAEPATRAQNRPGDHARVLITSGAAAAGSSQAPGSRTRPARRAAAREHAAGVRLLAPGLADSYKIVMGIAMGYMLLLML